MKNWLRQHKPGFIANRQKSRIRCGYPFRPLCAVCAVCTVSSASLLCAASKLCTALMLCASSKLLLLDEPVAGLDPKVTADMYEIIRSLNKRGITVIMVSHDIEAAVQYSTHILHVAHTPLFFGRTEDYLVSDAGATFLKGGKKND
jgi:ABC-type transport system involved in cytochrome bd biosynthesis fused ATPase/permease subunit